MNCKELYKNTVRNMLIMQSFREGLTHAEMSEKFGLTKEEIKSIIVEHLPENEVEFFYSTEKIKEYQEQLKQE